MTGPDYLIKHDVVVITINYRLHIFGTSFRMPFRFLRNKMNARGTFARGKENYILKNTSLNISKDFHSHRITYAAY